MGPLFAYSNTINGARGYGQLPQGSTTGFAVVLNTQFTYAVATPLTSTVPEPSEILGTLAFGATSAGYLLKRQRGNKIA